MKTKFYSPLIRLLPDPEDSPESLSDLNYGGVFEDPLVARLRGIGEAFITRAMQHVKSHRLDKALADLSCWNLCVRRIGQGVLIDHYFRHIGLENRILTAYFSIAENARIPGHMSNRLHEEFSKLCYFANRNPLTAFTKCFNRRG